MNPCWRKSVIVAAVFTLKDSTQAAADVVNLYTVIAHFSSRRRVYSAAMCGIALCRLLLQLFLLLPVLQLLLLQLPQPSLGLPHC
jgi:hypothetical protein